LERGLHRMHVTIGSGQPLDGDDVGAFGLDRQHGAGLDGVAIDVNRARTALAGIAANVGASQSQLVTQKIHEQRAWFDFATGSFAIDGHGNGLRHGAPPQVSIMTGLSYSIALRWLAARTV